MASKDEREFDSGLTGGTDVPALEEDFSLEEILAEYGAGREQRLMEAVEQEARRETEPAAPPAEGGAKKPPLQTEARPRPAPQVTEKTAPPQKPPAQPEDLLEELVGNIYDEFDPQEEQDIIRLEDNKWRVSGSADLEELAEAMGLEALARVCGVGVPTLADIIKELMKPGRDPRDELPAPILRTDVMEARDLKPGMELQGTVRNVIDFGAFVDIGVHQDGLVHISKLPQRVKHPSQLLSVGDVVTVWVLEVDEKKKRISLTMKKP